VDGLLLTRRERLRGYTEKTGLVVGPSVVLALVELALGLWVVAVFVAAVAGMVALAAGSSLRTRKGSAVFGVCLLAAILLFLLVASWFISHPIQKGD
jgi:tellurite resistance protein TehA-like permease